MHDFAGIDGFLGTRASLMLDVVFLAMFAVVPVMGVSIYQVKVQHRFRLHKRLQLLLVALLGFAVTLFEIDIRLNGWRDRAAASPYFSPDGARHLGDYVLWVHLAFAISTTLLWAVVTVRAVRNFAHDPRPSFHSRSHRFWGWVAAIDMAGTAATGWVFYYLAFVA
jgi:hypothetical protein